MELDLRYVRVAEKSILPKHCSEFFISAFAKSPISVLLQSYSDAIISPPTMATNRIFLVVLKIAVEYGAGFPFP